MTRKLELTKCVHFFIHFNQYYWFLPDLVKLKNFGGADGVGPDCADDLEPSRK